MPHVAPGHTPRSPGPTPGSWRRTALVVGVLLSLLLAGGAAVVSPLGGSTPLAFGPAAAPATPSSGGSGGVGLQPDVLNPTLVLTPTSGPVGATVSFSASQFAKSSAITITWTPVSVTGAKVTACSGKTVNGVFSCTYKIPATAAGVYPFTAADAAGHVKSANFQVVPTLTDLPATGPVGTIVIVTGTAFGSTSSSTTITTTVVWNGVAVCPGSTTNLYGNFTCAFALPAASSGSHAFVALDSRNETASATFTVVPKLTVAPTYGYGQLGFGPTGSTVRFRGTGFAASASVTVKWPVGTACVLASSPNGGFNCTYTIPADAPGGLYTFQANDGTNPTTSVPFAVSFLQGSVTAATVGTPISFAVGGFSPNTTITVGWLGGTLFSGSTNATGAVPALPFTVPSLAAGPYVFRASDASGINASFVLTVVPLLVVTPFGGPSPSATVWNGSGFAASSPVVVSWTGGTACTSTTNATGSFSCSYTVPTATPGGVYTFEATDGLSHTASATFTVTYLAVLPPTGPVGTPVVLSGGGYAANSSYNVTLGSSVVCTGTTSASGGFSCSATRIPASPAGALTFVALDGSGTTASVTFTVVPQLSVRQTGGLASGPVGSKLTFTGTGYAASASVSVGWARGTACTNTTDAAGNFSCSFVLPSTPVGPYLFTAVDAASNTARASFTVVPSLTVAPSSGAAGTTVLLQAAGFAAGSPIAVSSPLAVACSGVTDTLGSFACTYPIPSTTKGPLLLTAVDRSSDSATASFGVAPQLSATPSAGSAGVVVAFAGSGYVGGASVTVSWSAGPACSATASAAGGFSCDYVLPPATAGAHTFTGKDSASSADSATTVVTVVPQLRLSLTSGTVGSPLAVNGSGFAANATVTVNSSTATVCVGTAGTFGSFACTGTVPAAVVGNLTLEASDASLDVAFASVGIVPSLLASPASGPVGTNVTFVGGGFAGGSSVQVSWAHGTVCTAVADATGSFACSATMPPAPAGGNTFNATDLAGDTAGTSFSVVASINTGLTATPSGGPPGTVVTLIGNGFAAGVTVNVTWLYGLACSSSSDSSGSFSCQFTIPTSTPGGVYAFFVSDGRGDTAEASFVVTFLVAQPGSATVGAVVTLTGGGFAPSVSYSISWTKGSVCSGTTTPMGGFSCTLTIPSTASGNYTFTAVDGPGTRANATLRVLPQLAESLGRGPVGTAVTFTGAAFAPASSYFVNWSGGTACTGTTSGSGGFSCGFTLPAAPAGPHVFTASDAAGNTSSVTFRVVPTLVAGPSSGPVGSTVTFNGTGYAAGAAVTVSGAAGASCATTADASGGFTCPLTVPSEAHGSYLFVGSQGGGLPSASTVFAVEANLSVVPIVGPTGTTLSFAATGFGSSVAIALAWAGGTACAGTTGAAGAFTCTFYVPPALPGGNATFTASDALGNSASTLYLVVPAFAAAPAFGGPGTVTTFTGLGFKSTSAVSVTWAGGTACTSVTNATGQFSCSFTVPLGTTGGPYTFVAIDGGGNRATAAFVVTYLTVAPTAGPVGTLLTFNGAGFAPESSFAVTWGAGTACVGTTSASGTFRCNDTVAAAVAGTHTFTASDGSGDSASVPYSVTPSLSVSPGSGPSASHVTFTGTGFAGNLTVSVRWPAGTVCSATTDAVGGFSCSYTLPSLSVGLYGFTATDSASNAANTSFDVMLPSTFTVTFTQSGLAAGAPWTVVLNGASQTANTTTISFQEPNGNYSYTVRSAGYRAAPPSGALVVNGSTASVGIDFSVTLYTVAFSETGLSGTSWSVTIGATTLNSSGPAIDFELPNGTYAFSVAPLAGFTESPPNGTITVSGAAPATTHLAFTQVTYTLTFSETGLPSGRAWNVTVNGVVVRGTTSTLTVARPNGTYTYTAASVNFSATPLGGVVVVAGADPSAVDIVFASAGYAVTFATSGLPAGTTWTLVFGGGSPIPVTTANYTTDRPTGNYTWHVSAVGFQTSTAGGTVTVNGAPVVVPITFTARNYQLVIEETGVANGTPWQVSIVGGPVQNVSVNQMTFLLPNGTYYAVFDAPAGYAAIPSSGYVNLSGSRAYSVHFVTLASLVPPPPTTFLGFTGDTGYYVFAGIIAGCVGGSGGLGYYLARKRKVKSIGSDFL